MSPPNPAWGVAAPVGGDSSSLAALVVVVLVVAAVLAAFRALRTPPVVPVDADERVFSAPRAMRHVEEIARAPRPVGSAEHTRVREYLLDQLSALGLSPETQQAVAINEIDGMERGTRFRAAGEVRNVVAVVPGAPGAETRPAVLLVAHYDSVPSGPGANDNGAAVATLLETARALLATTTPLRNDVILLFTDAEEVGQLGARAFVERHPLRQRVGVVLNFEARGSRGAVLMFETGPGNARLVRLLAGTARRPYASSLFHEVYQRMPNMTDFAVFRDAGLPGLNFAYIDGYTHYHGASDTPGAVSRDSLQHQGELALGLARRLGEADLTKLTTGDDAVFFPLPGGLARYPASWSPPLTAGTLALWATVIVWSIVDSVGRIWERFLGVALGTAVGVLWLAVVVLTVGTLLRGIAARTPEFPFYGHPRRGGLAYLVALVSATVGSYALLVEALRPHLDLAALAVGGTVWWAVLTLATARRVASANYLAQWPLLSSALGMAVALMAPDVTVARLVGLALCVVAPVFLLAPLVHLTFVGLLLRGSAVPTAVIGLLAMLLTPAVDVVTAATGWALPALAGLTALVSLALAARAALTPPSTSDGFVGVLYALDGDTGEALWATVDDHHHARLAPGEKVDRDRLREFLPHSLHRYRRLPAPALPLPAPAVTVVNDRTEEGRRRIGLVLTSARDATEAVLVVSGAPVLSYAVEGVPAPVSREPSADWCLWLHALPRRGYRVDLVVPEGRRVVLRVVDRRRGLPPSAPSAPAADPDHLAAPPPAPAPTLGPGTACGATHVSTTTSL